MSERIDGFSMKRCAMIIEACLAMCAADLMLRLLPFRWVTSTLRRDLSSSQGSRPVVDDVAWAISKAKRFSVSAGCLRQVVAAAWMLRWRNIGSVIHYGVAKNSAGGFHAHAWLYSGETAVVGHRQAEEFTLLSTLP